MATLRVVLDTNVLVSGLIYPTGAPGRILAVWNQGRIQVILSRYILDELVRVLPKLKQSGMNAMEARDLVDGIAFTVELAEPESTPVAELRDSKDLPVLGTLIASRADYLITGDKDLLALADRYPIISPAEFWTRHGN